MKLHEIIPLILPCDRNVVYRGEMIFASTPDDDNMTFWDCEDLHKFWNFDVVRISGCTDGDFFAGLGEVLIDIVAPVP